MSDKEGTVILRSTDVCLSTLSEWQSEMWATMRRHELLRAKPDALNALVYEEIECDMVGWESERSLDAHIKGLQKIADKAPAGCKVVIEFDRESDYEGGYDTYRRIGFYRPPTAEEVEARKARNAEIRKVQAEAIAEREASERAEFERLSAKYAQGIVTPSGDETQSGSGPKD